MLPEISHCRKLRDLIKEAVLYYHCEIFALK